MKTAMRQRGLAPFDLVEEATQALRSAPASVLAAYYGGTIPFILGLLYFWTDMSRNGSASGHLAEASLGVTVLFFWMKFWQAVFCRQLRAHLAAQTPSPITFRTTLNLLVPQMILQPLGLLAIPLALLPIIPSAWVYAFFQNATALADPETGSVAKLIGKSRRQASLWPKQNWLMLAIVLFFAFIVFLNWVTVCLSLPQLLKMMFGVQSIYTNDSFALLNTTFFAGMFSLTYLCVDPILKSCYTLRCFYGESLRTGEDLRAELKISAGTAKNFALVLLVAMTCFHSRGASVAAPAVVEKAGVSPADLDKAIDQTIHERKFSWRRPRDAALDKEADQNFATRFFSKTGTFLRKCLRGIRDWIERLWKKLFPEKDHPEIEKPAPSGYGWIMAAQLLLYVLAGAVVIALLVLLYRVWVRREQIPVAVAEPVSVKPDLRDENIRADLLPEDGWMKLARELMEKGEFRLAMRALYLASLAHLAGKNLISIARFKSNRDYERELKRRAHAFKSLGPLFSGNIFAFERVWYGRHEVDAESVNQFAADVARLKGAE